MIENEPEKPSLRDLEAAKETAYALWRSFTRQKMTRTDIQNHLDQLEPKAAVLVRSELELLRLARKQQAFSIIRTPQMWADLFEEWRRTT